MRKTILLFFCVCCFLFQTKAQTCQPVWTNYTGANSGINGNGAIEGVAIDASGNKWFTTGGNGGVSVFNGTSWTNYNSTNSGLPNDNCYGIGIDNLNNKWIGASGSMVKFDGTTWTEYNSSNSAFPGTAEIRSVTVDAANNIWVGTQAGLAMFNGSIWTVYNPGNSGISSYGVMNVAIDANGKKWIATQGGGVSVFDGTTWTTYNTGNSGLPNNEVWAVGIHPITGDKWFGTLGGGVCKFDGSTWTTYNISNSPLLHNNVRALAFDGWGRVYFGGAFSNTGVSVFDGTAWTTYTPSNSALASSYVFAMATDIQGDVWVAGTAENAGSVIQPCPLAPPCTNDTVTVTVSICPADLPYIWNSQTITATGTGVDTLFLQNAAGCDSLVVLDLLPQAASWTAYTGSNSSLPSGSVAGLAMDHSGAIWATVSNAGVAKFDGSTWTQYTTANSGLPHDNTFGIGVDDNGDVWIGTFLGITKFDGTNWTVYNSGNSGFPNTQEVRTVKVDAANNIWAPTQIGLAQFNGSTWTVYEPGNSGIAGSGIMDIDFDAAGKKWIATQTAGVSVLDGSTWTTYNTGNSGLANDQVWALDIDASGNKWFGTWGSGLSKFDGSTWTTYNTGNSGLASNMIREIFIDQTGKIWVGTNVGVSVFDGTSWVSYNINNSGLVSTFLYAILQDTQGSIWMGGFENVNFAGGVSVFLDPCQPVCTPDTVTVTVNICSADLPYTWNGHTITSTGIGVDTLLLQNAAGCDSLVLLDLLPQTGTWVTYTDVNSTLPAGPVQGITRDLSGNMWATIAGVGVSKFDGTAWTTYTSANSGMPYDYGFGIGVDNTNNIWIGIGASLAGGIVKYDGTNWTTYNNSNSGFPNTQEVRTVRVDAANNVWAPTQTGLAMFDGSIWTTYTTANSGITSNGVMDIAFDASGKKWIGTQGGGVSILDGSTWSSYTTGNSGLVNNEVWAIAIDASGNKWFGTWGGGVSKFDGTTWTTYNTGNSGLVSNNVRETIIDANGNLWFGTLAGMSKFDGATWTSYTTSNSPLVSAFTFSMATDANGGVWAAGVSNNGISVFTDPCQPACLPTTSTDTHTACDNFTWIDGVTYTASNDTATYTLVNAAGCDSVITLNLSIVTSPDLSVAGALAACDAADLANVTINDANSTGATYTWFSDAACTTPVANPGNVTISGTYYVVGSAAACMDTASVSVNMGMAPDLSIAAAIHGCDAMDLDTLAINDANSTNATYAWFSDAACTVPVTNNILASGTYYAVGSAGACSDTVSTNISINGTFTSSVTVETDDLTVCAGSNVTFTAALVDGGMSPSYQWYKNGSPVGGNSGIYSTTSLTSTDEVYVVVSIPEPCAASASVESNHVTVTVTPVSVPQVSITVAPSNIFTPGQQVTFTALASAAGSNPTFTWLKNGSPIPGAPTSTTYSSTGLQNGDVISCIVHSNAVCAAPNQANSNSILMSYASGSGITDNGVPATVTVFPNPASDVVYIRIATDKNYPNAGIRMIDVAGRVVASQQRNIEAGEQQFQIETGSLANGMYQLQLTADGQIISTQKVIIGK